MGDLPFKEEWISDKESIRIFNPVVFDEELKWHFDEEDRIIEAIGETDWKFQFDNKLPILLENHIFIPKHEWHRVIKGTGTLKLKINK